MPIPAASSEFAIVIGVNEYANTKWNLHAAVPDALRFAQWLLGERGLPAENIRLHLSPVPVGAQATMEGPDGKAVTLPVYGATGRDIRVELIQRVLKVNSWGGNGEILWFYFAGHGCSHVQVRGDKQPDPVLLPADYKEIEEYNLPIGFSEIVEPLQGLGPVQQYFFLDACRDFIATDVYSNVPGVNRYIRNVVAGVQQRRKQFLMYASGPGQYSVETAGKGVFGDALLRALRGDPWAVTRVPGLASYKLTFERLHEFLKGRVEAELAGARLPPGKRDDYVQVPEKIMEPSEVTPLLCLWEDEAVIEATPLLVRMTPPAALAAGDLKMFYDRFVLDDPPNDPKGPPLEETYEFILRPANYLIKVSSTGYLPFRQPVSIPAQKPLDVLLEADGQGVASPVAVVASPVAVVASPVAVVAAPTLRFYTRDPLATVVVIYPGKSSTRKLAEVIIPKAAAGMYQAQVEGPEGPGPLQWFECGSMEGTLEFEVLPPLVQLGETQKQQLHELQLDLSGPYVEASELLGPLARLSMCSILVFAAYATHCMGSTRYMQRLRSLGVPEIPPEMREEGWLTILVGTKGSRVGGLSIEDWLKRSEVTVSPLSTGEKNGWPQALKAPIKPMPLPNFKSAAFVQVCVPAGGASVGLLLPETPNTRHAAVVMKGRVTVFAACVDDNGMIETQLFAFPLGQPGEEPGISPEELKLIERGQRYYAGQEDMPGELADCMIERMLNLKMQEPFAGCLTGYLMIEYGREKELYFSALTFRIIEELEVFCHQGLQIPAVGFTQ